MSALFYNGDCLEVMPTLEKHSFDAIICDLPYGTTACKWDSVIPFERLWENYKRLIKPNGAIVLFASQPFTSMLVMSNLEWFRYCWVWDKKIAGNPFTAKFQPLKTHEEICVFSKKTHHYYPQMKTGEMRSKGGGYSKLFEVACTTSKSDQYSPVSILEFSNAARGVHPTQKPIALMRYLVRTYTNPGDLVLDNTAGSFSTGVAAVMENRDFVGIEQDEHYFKIGKQRVIDAQNEVDRMLVKPWEITQSQPAIVEKQRDLLALID